MRLYLKESFNIARQSTAEQRHAGNPRRVEFAKPTKASATFKILLICLGLIAQNESITASSLIKLLHLKDADALRSWLHPLIDKGYAIGSEEHSKAKEYRVDPRVLRDSQYKGTTSLKRIESYRLKELIVEDLKKLCKAGLRTNKP